MIKYSGEVRHLRDALGSTARKMAASGEPGVNYVQALHHYVVDTMKRTERILDPERRTLVEGGLLSDTARALKTVQRDIPLLKPIRERLVRFERSARDDQYARDRGIFNAIFEFGCLPEPPGRQFSVGGLGPYPVKRECREPSLTRPTVAARVPQGFPDVTGLLRPR